MRFIFSLILSLALWIPLIFTTEARAENGFDCANAYNDGYQIMATFCSYSSGDIGRFWLRDQGSVDVPSSSKWSVHDSLSQQYNLCGTYSAGQVQNWGGVSRCYEAHVYWEKCPIGQVCVPEACPEGQVPDVNGACVPAPCDLDDTNFPQTDLNELFRWTQGDDQSTRCLNLNGTIQSKRTSCKEEYRCIKEQADDPRDCVPTGSYVKPKDGVFHEDISIDGVDFELHYQSAYLDANTSIINGWTFSSHARIDNNVLYLGNGNSYDVKDKVIYGINMTTVSVNGYDYLFDTSGKHIQTRSAYTKTPIYTFTYDTDNRLVSIADAYSQTTNLSYTTTGELQSIIAPNGQLTQLSINGDLDEVRYADNSAYNFYYDTKHYLISKTDPNGNLYQYNYNENGQIISSINPQNVAINFAQASQTDGTDNVITSALLNETKYKSFHLDAENMLRTEKTLPTGEVVVYKNSVDELSSSVERCGVTRTNLYAAKDPVTQKRSLISTTQTMPSALSKTTNIATAYTYDASENLATKTLSSTTNAKTSTSLTDYSNQEIQTTSAEGRTLTLKLDPLMRHISQSSYADLLPITYTYNEAGQVLQTTQGTRTETNTYDASGNLATQTDASGNITSYAYDARNRLVSITNAQGQVTSFSYDANSNNTRLTTPTPANFDNAFNTIDLQVSMTSPLGYTTNYVYDEEKRLTQMTRPSGKVIAHSYLNGQHISTQTPENSYNYTYDCGNKISQILKDSTEAVNYSYDGDLLTNMSYTGELNQIINYSYNSDFLASSIGYAGTTETLNYDNDGLLTHSGDFAIIRNSTNGLPAKISDTTFSQDRIFNDYGEIDKVTNMVNTKSTFSYEIMARYPNGQIKTKVEKLNNLDTTYNYEYDEMDRLKKVKIEIENEYDDDKHKKHKTHKKHEEHIEIYAYDQNGNRVKAIVNGKDSDHEKKKHHIKKGKKASYNIEDQIETMGDYTYTYNKDGYLSSKTDGRDTTSYVYGSLGELKQVSLPNNKVIEYAHNANNQRVAKKVDGVITEKYLWKDLTTLLAVYDGSDTLKQRYVYSDNRVPNKVDYEGVTYYLAYDQVGSLRAVIDTAGNVVKTLTYDSFGNILSDSNPSMSLPFAFAGGLYDSDTGLVRFGYRDYDAVTGKWTAKDPIGFDGGDTSLYGYVLSDPVNYFDPFGLQSMAGGHGQGRSWIPHTTWTQNAWNRSNRHNILPNLWNGLSNARPFNLLFDTFPKEGRNAYKNAHPAAQRCMDFSMTLFEYGATAGMSAPLSLPYDYYSGYNFNTYPSTPAGWLGWGTARANE